MLRPEAFRPLHTTHEETNLQATKRLGILKRRSANSSQTTGLTARLAMQPGRYEKRSTAAVAVMLTNRDPMSRTELTLTDNIRGRGARVITKTLWSANDSLVIKSLEGDLQSEARVIYRQPVRENVYAIGLELIAPTGRWQAKSS